MSAAIKRGPLLERNGMYRAGIGFALALASVMAPPCKAQGTPIVYQTPSGTGSLQKIVGQFGESDYEFLYRIHISDPAAFSATTANSATSGLDTRLYLFTLAGAGIAFNDDDSDADISSTLPAGNSLYAGIVPGDYLLAISGFDTVPYGSDDNAVFSDLTGGVNGPNTYGSGTLSYWGEDPIAPDGSYEIDLRGVTYAAAVKLNLATSPGSGMAGSAYVNVTGSGFPGGVITPVNVVVSLGSACGGPPVAATTASSVKLILGNSDRVQFEIPSSLAPGTYFVQLNDDFTGDANFVSANCSQLIVTM
jgi:hypothetical protein